MKERIKQLREAMVLSQAEFAEKIGLARTGVSSIENGQRVVQERHIRLILGAFPDVSEAWLRYGEGEMFKATGTEAERLVKQYGFQDIVGKLLTVYETLSPVQQEAVLEYARRFIATLVDDDGIEAKVAAYRQELLAEKEAGILSALRTDGAKDA